jgi:hypothetical protein
MSNDLFKLAADLYAATDTDWILRSHTIVTEPVTVSVELYQDALITFHAIGNTYEEAAKDVILQARREYVNDGDETTI